MFLSIGMLKQKYFLTDIFILSAEKQPIKLSWRKIEWLRLQRVGTPNVRQTVKKGIDMDLSISASLDGKCLKHISDNEIRISGNNRPYFREQAVKNVLHGMDLLWIYDGAFVRDTTELGRLYKTIKDNVQNVRIKKLDGKQAYCRYGMAGINGAIIIEAKAVKRKTKH